MTSSWSMAWEVLNTIITPTVPPSSPSTHPIHSGPQGRVVDKSETETARDARHCLECKRRVKSRLGPEVLLLLCSSLESLDRHSNNNKLHLMQATKAKEKDYRRLLASGTK
jgi:hypothetical protein